MCKIILRLNIKYLNLPPNLDSTQLSWNYSSFIKKCFIFKTNLDFKIECKNYRHVLRCFFFFFVTITFSYGCRKFLIGGYLLCQLKLTHVNYKNNLKLYITVTIVNLIFKSNRFLKRHTIFIRCSKIYLLYYSWILFLLIIFINIIFTMIYFSALIWIVNNRFVKKCN